MSFFVILSLVIYSLEYCVSHLHYLFTPCRSVLLEKLTGLAASQEIPRIFGARRFITVFTNACPQPPTTSWKFILILSSHLLLGLPSGLFPSGFPTRTLCTPLSSSIRATCPAHLILLDFTARTTFGKEYRSLSSSLSNFLHSPCYLVPFRPKYSPQHPILKHRQPSLLPQCQQQSFTPIQNNGQYDISIYLDL